MDLSILAHRAEYAAPAICHGIDNHAAIRRKARRFRIPPIRDTGHTTVVQIETCQLKSAIATVHIHDIAPVRRDGRGSRIATLEGQTPRTSTLARQCIDLWSPRTVGGEVQGLAIRRPDRLRLDRAGLRHLLHLARFQLHQVDIRRTIARQAQRKVAAIR